MKYELLHFQTITGNKYLTCERLTLKPTLSVKESNMEASVKKGCARRRQVNHTPHCPQYTHTLLNPVQKDLN